MGPGRLAPGTPGLRVWERVNGDGDANQVFSGYPELGNSVATILGRHGCSLAGQDPSEWLRFLS